MLLLLSVIFLVACAKSASEAQLPANSALAEAYAAEDADSGLYNVFNGSSWKTAAVKVADKTYTVAGYRDEYGAEDTNKIDYFIELSMTGTGSAQTKAGDYVTGNYDVVNKTLIIKNSETDEAFIQAEISHDGLVSFPGEEGITIYLEQE